MDDKEDDDGDGGGGGCMDEISVGWKYEQLYFSDAVYLKWFAEDWWLDDDDVDDDDDGDDDDDLVCWHVMVAHVQFADAWHGCWWLTWTYFMVIHC